MDEQTPLLTNHAFKIGECAAPPRRYTTFVSSTRPSNGRTLVVISITTGSRWTDTASPLKCKSCNTQAAPVRVPEQHYPQVGRSDVCAREYGRILMLQVHRPRCRHPSIKGKRMRRINPRNQLLSLLFAATTAAFAQ